MALLVAAPFPYLAAGALAGACVERETGEAQQSGGASSYCLKFHRADKSECTSRILDGECTDFVAGVARILVDTAARGARG